MKWECFNTVNFKMRRFTPFVQELQLAAQGWELKAHWIGIRMEKIIEQMFQFTTPDFVTAQHLRLFRKLLVVNLSLID